MRKITFVFGLAAGYLLGTRDGRARYEQVVRAVQGVKATPAVQETAGVLQAQVVQLVKVGMSKLSGQLGAGAGTGAPDETAVAQDPPDYSAGSDGLMR